MSFKVWFAEEGENIGCAKTYQREPSSHGEYGMDAWATSPRDAAEVYADYFHSQRDGWESTWPVEFFVRDMETDVVQRFSVDRETVPEFHADKGSAVAAGPHDHDDCECGHPFGFVGPCDRLPHWGTCSCAMEVES